MRHPLIIIFLAILFAYVYGANVLLEAGENLERMQNERLDKLERELKL